jgi:putative transposase
MVSAEDNFNEFKRHMFNLFLTYKAEWYGKEIRRVDRFFASSKTCSGCGWKNETLSLSDRVYACPVCGLNIDRDLNAAISTAKRTLTGAVTIPNEASMLNFVEPSIYI